MKEGKTFKNFAFISYSHADKKAAEELQKVLDEFQLSDALKEKYPNRPEVLREIFRDDTGLPAGSNLTKEIQKQLEQSNYLIVICSPNAAKSEWVNKEIDYFKTHRDSTHIIPFIIDGVANAKNANDQECFPTALKCLEVRGANISTFSFERAVVEVIAGALEIDVDDLWQRHVRAEEAKKRQLQEQRDKLLIVQSRFLAEKANALVEEGDSYTARLLALEALPKDLSNPDRPLVKEAIEVFKEASLSSNAIFYSRDNYHKIIVSPNGEYIAAISEKKRLTLRKIKDGTLVFSLGRNQKVRDVTFSIDGKLFAVARDKSIVLYCIQPNDHIALFCKISTLLPIMLKFSIGGTTLFSLRMVKSDKCVDLFNIEDKNRTIKKDHNIYSQVKGCCLNLNHNAKVLIWGTKGIMHIWDAINGNIQTLEQIPSDNCISADFSFDEQYVVALTKDGVIFLWDVKSGRIKWRKKVPEDILSHLNNVKFIVNGGNSVRFNHDGSLIISAHNDGRLYIWGNKNGELIRWYDSNVEGHNYACFSPNDSLLVSFYKDGIIRLWDIGYKQKYSDIIRYIENVNNAHYSCDGKNVVVTSNDGNVYLVTSMNNGSVNITNTKLRGSVSWDFFCDEKTIVSLTDGFHLHIWNYETGALLRNVKIDSEIETSAISSSTSIHMIKTTKWGESIDDSDLMLQREFFSSYQKNKRKITECNWSLFCKGGKKMLYIVDNVINVVNVNTGARICKKRWPFSYVKTAFFSFDGNYVVSVSEEKICIWECNNPNENDPMVLLEHQKAITYAKMSPDNTMVASISNDCVLIWDIKIKKVKYSISEEGVKFLTWSVDGRYLAYASKEKVVIRDVNHEMIVRSIQIKGALFIEFCPEGNYLLSVFNDSIRIWDINIKSIKPIQQLINETREQFKDRPLSTEERKKYYLD